MSKPKILAQFSVGSDTYRLATVSLLTILTLFREEKDEFGTPTWVRCSERAFVLALLEKMTDEDAKWRAQWAACAQEYPAIGRAVLLGGNLDPVLVRTYKELHGSHGRGGETFEVDTYHPKWACLVEGGRAVKVWEKVREAPTVDILLRMLLRLTEEA